MMQTYKVCLCIKFFASKCDYKLKKHYFVKSTNEEKSHEHGIKTEKKHGAENVDSITDEQSAIRHFRAQSKVF
nr:hypothetical protein [Staphylococcus aureus]